MPPTAASHDDLPEGTPMILQPAVLLLASFAADYNTHTKVAIKNEFPAAATITLTHHYSDDHVFTETWKDIAPGAVTPGWEVGYNTGFGRTGKDYWNVTVRTTEAVFQNATHDKECFLTKQDANTTLVFKVSESRFFLDMRSSGCTDAMAFEGYNTNTHIAVKNHFHRPISITLSHRYSNDKVYSHTWHRVAPGAVTPGWRVGYNTGLGKFGMDYWNVIVSDGDSVWKNTKRDKECFLTKKDSGTTLVFGVTPTAFHLNMNSSSCSDHLAMTSTTRPRPVWIVAHMCNSPKYILDALTNGANGVEFDIECKQVGDGFAFEVHHGFAGPGYDSAKADARTPLDTYLKAVHAHSLTHPGYVFQYFDCKIPDGLSDDVLGRMGAELVKQIRAHLYDIAPASQVYSLVNCADLKKVAFLRFAKDLGRDYGSRHLGVTVNQKGEPSQVHTAFTRMGIVRSGWYTHGTNIILPSLFEDTMRQAVDMREAGQFNKVCEWTVNKVDSIETLMTIGIDSVLCDTSYTVPVTGHHMNGVKNFLSYVHKSKLVRLATKDDDPFGAAH